MRLFTRITGNYTLKMGIYCYFCEFITGMLICAVLVATLRLAAATQLASGVRVVCLATLAAVLGAEILRVLVAPALGLDLVHRTQALVPPTPALALQILDYLVQPMVNYFPL